MNILRLLFSCGFLFVTLIRSGFYETDGEAGTAVVHLVGNLAWNEILGQIKLSPQHCRQDSHDQEILVVLKCRKTQKTKARVGNCDPEMLNAVEPVGTLPQQADRYVEALGNDFFYGNAQARRELICGI